MRIQANKGKVYDVEKFNISKTNKVIDVKTTSGERFKDKEIESLFITPKEFKDIIASAVPNKEEE